MKEDRWAELDKRFEIDSLDYHEIKIDFTTVYSDKVFYNLTTLIITKMWKIFDTLINEKDATTQYTEILKNWQIVQSLLSQIRLNIWEWLVKCKGDISKQLILYIHWLEEIDIVQKFVINVSIEPYLEDTDSQIQSYEVYKEAKMNADSIFKNLKERLQDFNVTSSNWNMLDTIYDLRMKIFSIFDLKYFWAHYAMLKSSLYSEFSTKHFETLLLFKEWESMKNLIPNFELENAKHMVRSSNSLSAIEYLNTEIDCIRKKWHKIAKDHKQFASYGIVDISWPSKVKRYILEVKAKSWHNQNDITDQFIDYIDKSSDEPQKISDFYNTFARYLDSKCGYFKEKFTKPQLENMNLTVQTYYHSIWNSNQYLWQALPRMLEIWFNAAK